MKIVGRQHEQRKLQRAFDSDKPEFIAIYGRRRVGKTYLIREFFKDRDCVFFHFSGTNKEIVELQLEKFKKQLGKVFQGIQLPVFNNWNDAFECLTNSIEISDKQKKVVIFLDEIPWMDTPESGLINALSYYWNMFWSSDPRVKLIICGSAASWIINNILLNTGGLHNRATLHLEVKPFSLADTKDYLYSNHVYYNNEEITKIYMSLGGIPHYLNHVENVPAVQNINHLFFNEKSSLYNEFRVLFASLFKNHKIHERIIVFIASKREGITKSELIDHLKIEKETLIEKLSELEQSKFVICFQVWNKKDEYYKVIDEYTLFYLSWVKDIVEKNLPKKNSNYWGAISPAWQAWSGLAFEAICYKHINGIERILCIPDDTTASPWKYIPKNKEEKGAQIDLVFDRPDNNIILCEIKYCATPFSLDQEYYEHLKNREEIYCRVTKTKKQIFHSMIISAGLKSTQYSQFISSYATLDDLFKAG